MAEGNKGFPFWNKFSGWASGRPGQVFISYTILWLINLYLQFYYIHLRGVIIPVVLLFFPLFFKKDIGLRFSFKDLFLGLSVSALIFAPLLLLHLYIQEGIPFFNKKLQMPGGEVLLYQLFGVALPEEVFFRGFIQASFGNRFNAVIYTSLLFSLAHLPVVLAGGDPIVLLTFFPSLVMGVLYKKTFNILPSVVFHFFSNLFFLSFY